MTRAFRRSEEENSEKFKPVETLLVPTGRVDGVSGRRVEYWSFKWAARPLEEVCCGVRPLSGADDDYVRAAAASTAWKAFPGEFGDKDHVLRVDVFNDALMRVAITRATCDANDVRRPWDIWGGAPDDVIKVALTRDGVKALYDAIERVSLSLSPVAPRATDEEIDSLFLCLKSRLEIMPKARADRARRLLRFLLDECAAYDPASVDAAE